MYPIFERGKGEGIGISFETFIKRFTDICQEHIEYGRAKALAFILYNFEDEHINEILENKGGFTQLDRLTGSNLSVFYFNSGNVLLFEAFNDIFLDAFEINEDRVSLPFVLFFKVVDKEVTDIKIVEIEQTNLMFAFKELYDIIQKYINSTINKNTKKIKLKTNKLIKIWDSIKNITLAKFIEWLIKKGAEYAGQIN